MGRITLTCRAFRLYTRVATLTWLQYRKPVQQKTFGSETILPSGDGTYQAWVSIRVLPGQEPQFSCNLRHGNHSIMQTAVSGEKMGQPPTSGVGRQEQEGPIGHTMTTHFMAGWLQGMLLRTVRMLLALLQLQLDLHSLLYWRWHWPEPTESRTQRTGPGKELLLGRSGFPSSLCLETAIFPSLL